jgi:glycosyltransferase involved in cell wall biosynthesis
MERMDEASRVMFLYWGRRGSLTKLAHDLHSQALSDKAVRPTLSISRQSENFDASRRFGDSVFAIDTFSWGIGAAKGIWRIPALGRALARRLRQDGTQAVVTLMPHIWTPFLIPYVRRAGVRYATIIHDASAHPGDRTGIVNDLIIGEARRADVVITLSETVRERLIADGRARAERIVRLFHPDMIYDGPRAAGRAPGEPFRLLFFGRIMRYKGLGLLVEALEMLRGQGPCIELGIYGEGPIAPYGERLQALGAVIENRWLADAEVAEVLSRYHAVALSHVEASQSGVAAAAFGAGLPVVATPVGGLKEQVADGVNGVLADDVSAAAFAAALARLAGSADLYAKLRENLRVDGSHSMQRFMQELVGAVLRAPRDPD